MADKEPLIVPPEETPALRTTEISSRPKGREIVRAAIAAIVVLAAIVLLVFAGRWVYHKTHHHTYVQPANTKQLPGLPSSSNTQPGAKPADNNSATKPSNSTSSNQANNLPNSGPGSVAVVFVGSSVAAGSLHYIATARKAKNLS